MVKVLESTKHQERTNTQELTYGLHIRASALMHLHSHKDKINEKRNLKDTFLEDDIGECNFGQIFNFNQYIKMPSFQQVINMKHASRILHVLFPTESLNSNVYLKLMMYLKQSSDLRGSVAGSLWEAQVILFDACSFEFL